MYKFALLGCGRIAKRHADLLNGIISDAQLVAVCDIDPEKACAFGKQYNVAWYTDMEEMMRKSNPDVVSVLTPSGLHSQHVITLASYGKHIVVEKPMALTLNDADAMITACDTFGCRLFIVKQNRFNIPVTKLYKAIQDKRFGKLIMGTVRVRWCRPQTYYDQDAWRGTWGLDGGVLTNQASHHIDLLEWMMGRIQSVYAKSITALANIEAEDTAIAVLKFQNGALGCIEATTATRPADVEGSISILGEKGIVEIGGIAVNQIKVWSFCETTQDDLDVMERYSVNPPNVYGFGHQAYYDHVVSCLKSNSPQLIDGLEGRHSIETISAIYESIETGEEVYLRFTPQQCRLGIQSG